MENLNEEIQSIINRLTDDDGCAYPNTPQVTRACEDLHKLKTKVKNLAQPDVSGQFCGTCETELQLWNIKFKKWYCPQCRTYLPQYFR